MNTPNSRDMLLSTTSQSQTSAPERTPYAIKKQEYSNFSPQRVDTIVRGGVEALVLGAVGDPQNAPFARLLTDLPVEAGEVALSSGMSSDQLPSTQPGLRLLQNPSAPPHDVMVIGPRAEAAVYNALSGAFENLVYADARDEIFRDTRCGKKLREYWWAQNLIVRQNPPVYWIVVFRVVVYERCVEVFVGGGRWVGGKVVPDPALPTIPLWDVPWVEIKTAGGHFVRMGVILFRRGDTIVAGAGNGVGPASERSGGFVVLESDCPNWTYHRFKRGAVTIDFCDPNKADVKIPPNPGDDQKWVPDEPPQGLPTEPAAGGGTKIGVDVPGDWPQDIKALGEANGYKSYTVTREYLTVVCCQNKIIAVFYLPLSRTYTFTCKPGNQGSTYTGWSPSGGDPTPIDPGNPPPAGSKEAGLLGEALRLARNFRDC